MIYHAKNWYWIVTHGHQAWSSAALNYVEMSNTAFLGWQAAGGHPTKIANTTDLIQVMIQQVQPGVMMRGIQLKSSTNPDLNGHYALDEATLATMTNRAIGIGAKRPLPGGGPTFNFLDAVGASHAFTGPQFVAFVNACDSYLYNWQQALITCINGQGAAYPSMTISIS